MASNIAESPYAARRARLAAELSLGGADAILVMRPVNVRYLTGLASSNAGVLVYDDGRAVLATDSRYAGTARQVAADLPLVEDRAVAATLIERARKGGAGGLAFEAHAVTVELHGEMTRQAGPLQLIPQVRTVEGLRAVKDDAEIELLRAACEISDRALEDTVARIAPGVTEREIARLLEFRMMELGAERTAFDTIVASGPNGAIPHHSPSDRPVRRGDLITMDFGAVYRGYHADMTRTVALGEPAAWQREIYELVRQAQSTGRRAAHPAASAHDVDAAARSVIADAGYGDHFEHGLGHGVGLEIHEAPFLGPHKAGTLEDRVPITIEPGVYLPGKGGVRIEDTVVVRPDGPELLTKTTKELLVL
ncbi:M24 family metallopeptidase [Bailinhaonella thermotolerans]|uniref:Aminopeptidase P family protein n=1 Tax=Bailinhaonella thermotolerans TaxID=1070861 RepID=A0A3A4B236_9ACTN|nr:aminopeptidase P family protein [Bailinhaonella thermotolerans]RJL31460.1 aminopeptidase P family protein [Bailinhaonella thermotolerans]